MVTCSWNLSYAFNPSKLGAASSSEHTHCTANHGHTLLSPYPITLMEKNIY